MRTILRTVGVLCTVVGLAASAAAQPADPAAAETTSVPGPRATGYVIDEAGLLSTVTVETLNSLLRDHEVRTSNQVVVIVVSTLGGEPIENVALRRATTLGVGQKDRDNGVVLLVAPNERKVRIEVGYGLEGALPDGLCGQIIREEIIPRFKQLDYAGGIQAGVQSILGAIRGEYRATALSRARGLFAWLPARPTIPLAPQVIGGIFFWLLSAVWLFVGPELFSVAKQPVCLGVIPGLFIAAFVVYLFPGVLIPLAVGVVGLLDKRYKILTAASGTGGGSSWSSSDSSSSSFSSSSSDSSSDSFSGGGGDFGGGGASGGW